MTMKSRGVSNDPVWTLFECERGARWSSVSDKLAPEWCEFSGCDSRRHMAVIVKTTTDRDEASKWFRRPEVTNHDH